MRGAWIGLIVLAWGCADASGGDDGDDGGTSDPDLPSPYAESGDTEEIVPSLGTDEVVDASIAGLQTFVSLQPDALLAAYLSIAADAAEPGCPETYEAFEEDGAVTTIWYSEAECTTAAGVAFRGSARISTTSFEDGDVMVEAVQLSSEGGTMRVSGPGGAYFEMAGYAATERAVSPAGVESGFSLTGKFSADAGTAAGSPLLDGSVAAQGYLFAYSDGSANVLAGSGSLSGDGLSAGEALAFSDFLIARSGCAAEPLGTVSIRDESGYWHDIVFDAGTFEPESDDDVVFDAAQCDGCGAYLVGGERVGEVCVSEADVQSLVAWEGSPW